MINGVRKLIMFYFLLVLVPSKILSQNNLEDKLKELNRLQAKLEAMQEKKEKIPKIEDKEKVNHSIENMVGRYQIINMVYETTVPNTNTLTSMKGFIMIDTVTGDCWRYVYEGYEEYWKKIDYSE